MLHDNLTELRYVAVYKFELKSTRLSPRCTTLHFIDQETVDCSAAGFRASDATLAETLTLSPIRDRRDIFVDNRKRRQPSRRRAGCKSSTTKTVHKQYTNNLNVFITVNTSGNCRPAVTGSRIEPLSLPAGRKSDPWGRRMGLWYCVVTSTAMS